jgi:hypothetical protein
MASERERERERKRNGGFWVMLGACAVIGVLIWSLLLYSCTSWALDLDPSEKLFESPLQLLRLEWPLLCVGTQGKQWIRSWGDKMPDKRPKCVDADLTKRKTEWRAHHKRR